MLGGRATVNSTGRQWHLDPADVTESGMVITSGSRKHATHSGRATPPTEVQMELLHVPTGLKVTGEVPRGNYSRTQMQEHKKQLYPKLFQELEDKVAKHLRIPRR